MDAASSFGAQIAKQIANHLRDKKLLILGLGREGQSILRFLAKHLPEVELTIADQNPLDPKLISNLLAPNQSFKLLTGENYLAAAKDADLILKSPGVIIKDYLNPADKAKITSMTDLFLRFCPCPIIGITGTKGKSTTASLAHHILEYASRPSLLLGNIGKPCFDALDQLRPDTIVILELSSHQLEFVHASPKVAILLNLYEEHLDHYKNAADYYAAKLNIYKYQDKNDLLIYGDIFQHVDPETIKSLPMRKIDLYHNAHISSVNPQSNLLGEHSKYDIFAAVYAVKEFGINEKDALEAVKTFRGLPHRLEYIGTHRKIKFYNDSIATAQEATIAAVKALGDVDTLILGGMDRGLDYQPIVNFLMSSPVKHLILLPNTAVRLRQLLEENRAPQKLHDAENLAAAVRIAYEITAAKKSCLLSPAAASYGFYKNFEARGDDFRRLVLEGGEGE